ncbi:sugar phosphate nucleotidyltransferase, partial [Parabacteroides merdae]
MQIILLSGGSGKRLWPLSNESRSKQFLRLLPSPDGGRESMV